MTTEPKVLRAPGKTLETPHEPFWRETWFYEQLCYAVLLGLATWKSYELLATKGPVGPRDLVLLGGSFLGQFIAQKARSAAARQAALIKRSKHVVPEVRCSPKIKRWSQAGQVLMMFMGIATSPSWAHVPLVIWSLFAYDAWRAWREKRKDERAELTEVLRGF